MPTRRQRKAKEEPGPILPVMPAPLLWRLYAKTACTGLLVDEELAWVGNTNGELYAIEHGTGRVARNLRLPDGGIFGIGADGPARYAIGTDWVCDVTERAPRLAFAVSSSSDIESLAVFAGNLVVTNANGAIGVVDAGGDELRWRVRNRANGGGSLCADAGGIYWAHERGVTKLGWNGDELWVAEGPRVRSVSQRADALYLATTEDLRVLAKDTGALTLRTCVMEGGLGTCVASPDGARLYVAAGDFRIGCFDAAGAARWTLDSGCGDVHAMQVLGARVYVAGDGFLGCIDAADAAIEGALAGDVGAVEERRDPPVQPVAEVEGKVRRVRL